MKLCELLENKRKYLGMSKHDVATLVGVTDRAYALWEYGECIPYEGNLSKLCNVFNIPVDKMTESVIEQQEYIDSIHMDNPFKDIIENRMRELNLTRKEVYTYVGVTRQCLSNWLTKIPKVDCDSLVRLSKVLSVDVIELAHAYVCSRGCKFEDKFSYCMKVARVANGINASEFNRIIGSNSNVCCYFEGKHRLRRNKTIEIFSSIFSISSNKVIKLLGTTEFDTIIYPEIRVMYKGMKKWLETNKVE